jgi:hypothetical protein
MEPKLWTIQQIVTYLKERGLEDVNDKWVKNRCDRGEIPYTVVGNKRRIRSDVIEKIVANWMREAA